MKPGQELNNNFTGLANIRAKLQNSKATLFYINHIDLIIS